MINYPNKVSINNNINSSSSVHFIYHRTEDKHQLELKFITSVRIAHDDFWVRHYLWCTMGVSSRACAGVCIVSWSQVWAIYSRIAPVTFELGIRFQDWIKSPGDKHEDYSASNLTMRKVINVAPQTHPVPLIHTMSFETHRHYNQIPTQLKNPSTNPGNLGKQTCNLHSDEWRN